MLNLGFMIYGRFNMDIHIMIMMRKRKSLLLIFFPGQLKRKKADLNVRVGGKLNPEFVEFLMAYPTDWTKIEQTELKR